MSSKSVEGTVTTHRRIKPHHFTSRTHTALKPLIENHIFIPSNVTPRNQVYYDEILLQLIVLALKDGFLELNKVDENIVNAVAKYVNCLNKSFNKIIKDKLKDPYKKEHLVFNLLNYLKNNYYPSYPIKSYIIKVIKNYGRSEQLENMVTLNESFQIFKQANGKIIGVGVDRAALEHNTTRDKIYRLVRSGELKVKKKYGFIVLHDNAQKQLKNILAKEQKYADFVSTIMTKREIKKNSAQKALRRLKEKRLNDKQILQKIL